MPTGPFGSTGAGLETFVSVAKGSAYVLHEDELYTTLPFRVDGHALEEMLPKNRPVVALNTTERLMKLPV